MIELNDNDMTIVNPSKIDLMSIYTEDEGCELIELIVNGQNTRIYYSGAKSQCELDYEKIRNSIL